MTDEQSARKVAAAYLAAGAPMPPSIDQAFVDGAMWRRAQMDERIKALEAAAREACDLLAPVSLETIRAEQAEATTPGQRLEKMARRSLAEQHAYEGLRALLAAPADEGADPGPDAKCGACGRERYFLADDNEWRSHAVMFGHEWVPQSTTEPAP